MTEWIVVFLLFFSVLAAGWFYFQRAKARDSVKQADTDSTVASDRAQ